ncbi:MAG TPA: serine hydrolase domain-containing protein [Acidimicrobiales bacterium]
MSDRLEAVRARVEADVAEGLFATGGQLYVSVDREPVLDLAVGVDGIGAEVGDRSLFAVYCAAKPVFAVALATLVDEGEVSLDDRLGDVVERPLHPALAGLAVSQLLDHSAGLHGLDAHAYMAASTEGQTQLVLGSRPAPGWTPGHGVAYAQVTPWDLLGLAVEDLAGVPVRRFVAERVLGPARAGDELFVAGLGDDDFVRLRDRLAVNIYLEGPAGDPILAERTRRFRCVASPAVGSTASARGLGRFYELCLDIWHGRSEVLSPGTLELFAASRNRGHDPVMGRECSYGYGFMTDLEGHEFGPLCGRRAFGHTGYGGMTAAMCDPDSGLVIAFHFNGRIDADSAVNYRRPSLVTSIYRAVLGSP